MLFVGGNVVSVIMGMCMRSGQGSAVGIYLLSIRFWFILRINPEKLLPLEDNDFN